MRRERHRSGAPVSRGLQHQLLTSNRHRASVTLTCVLARLRTLTPEIHEVRVKRVLFACLFVCLAAASVHVDAQNSRRQIRRARARIANQYIVTMATADDPEAVAHEYEGMYAGRLRHVYGHALRGFAIRLSAA